ncbi:MAG: DDE-type integrase/transposase/recombinase, partial [Roseiarcus sp.]
MVYLWRPVDADGEVLDVLVRSTRNKHAALKLMRRLLKKYAFVPERLVTDDLRSYSAAVRDLGSSAGMSAGNGRTVGLRIRTSRHDGASARCRGTGRNFVRGAIIAPMEGEYGDQEGHAGRSFGWPRPEGCVFE